MSKTKMPLADARKIAAELLDIFEPHCHRVAVAGSVRRCKPEVGDIEIVAIPKTIFTPNLFGEMLPSGYETELAVEKLIQSGAVVNRGADKYKSIALPQGINLDLFLVLPPAQWGVIFMIRTGSGDYSKHMVTPKNKGGALPSYYRIHDGAVWQGEKLIPMDDEQDFYRICQIDYIEPEKRGWQR